MASKHKEGLNVKEKVSGGKRAMSDFEEKRNLGEKVVDNQERIAELGKRIGHAYTKISELEKKYSDISDLYVQLEEENGDRCREIAELRQYTIDTQNRLDDAYNIINELKEQFKMFSGGEE